MRVATYNLGSGTTDSKVADLEILVAMGCDAIGLQEGSDRAAVLDRFLTRQPGWAAYRGDGSGGAAAVPILYEAGEHRGRGFTIEAVPARNVAGADQPGGADIKRKVINGVRFGGVAILNTHLLPAWTKSREVLGEESYRLRREHARDHVAAVVEAQKPYDYAVCVGDWNGEPDHPILANPLGAAGLVQVVDFWTHGGDRIIDLIWKRRMVSRGVEPVDLTSDHRAAVATLVREGVTA